jgi:hypothetical protein
MASATAFSLWKEENIAATKVKATSFSATKMSTCLKIANVTNIAATA